MSKSADFEWIVVTGGHLMAAEQWTEAASASRTRALVKRLCAVPASKPEFLPSPLQQVFAGLSTQSRNWKHLLIFNDTFPTMMVAFAEHIRYRGCTAWSHSLMNHNCSVQLKPAVFLQVKQRRASLKNRLDGVQWLLLLDVLCLSLLVNSDYIPQLTEAPFTC